MTVRPPLVHLALQPRNDSTSCPQNTIGSIGVFIWCTSSRNLAVGGLIFVFNLQWTESLALFPVELRPTDVLLYANGLPLSQESQELFRFQRIFRFPPLYPLALAQHALARDRQCVF